ncbi:MAG: secretin N-terminal domain-containing protein [Acidobacteriota bacterium]
MKRISVAMLFLLFVSVAAFADAADVGKNLSVRTFQFKHKQADQAAAMIKSLMSGSGSFTVQPTANSLVVTDDPENLKRIAAAIAQFDAPPQPFQLSVRLVSAARGGGGRRVPENLRDIESKLALLRYDTVEALGSANVDGKEGDAGTVDLATYRADFHFGEYDPASDSIKISDFKLSRLDGDQVAPMMKTTLNLKLGQTVIMAVTRDAQSQRALMMVLSARR